MASGGPKISAACALLVARADRNAYCIGAMLIEDGEVREVGDGRALVLVRQSSACGKCSARGACLTFGSMERTVEVRDPLGTNVGDRVKIGIRPARVVWASLLAYVFPVISMVVGALIGAHVGGAGSRDGGAAIGAFAGLALSFLAVFVIDRVRKGRLVEMPTIVDVEGGPSAGRNAARGGVDPR